MLRHITPRRYRPSGSLRIIPALVTVFLSICLRADPAPPALVEVILTNQQPRVGWTPYPSTVEYRLFSSDRIEGPYAEEIGGVRAGFGWTGPSAGGNRFFRLEAVPMAGDDLTAATALNRLAYGPTPDELARVRGLGGAAYVSEQLAPELIEEDLELDRVEVVGGWRRVVLTGTATSSRLYVYLTSPGQIYVDDIRLVRGTNVDTGTNLVRNGDFEVPLTTADWSMSTNFSGSSASGDQAATGAMSLQVVASDDGSGSGNSIWQNLSPSLSNGQIYTLSYWYYAPSGRTSDLIIRLSNSSESSGLYAPADGSITLGSRLEQGWARLGDLRAWHIQHAVQSRRQLVEVLAQFLENHFVTQHSKSDDYLERYYDSSSEQDRRATRMEWVENRLWREALLRPDSTFHDLLRISAESPAMILYLDTVSSRGDGGRIANENYARELFELFCNGVDNGYDQTDIEQMSRVWTGWRIRLVDANQEFNPFAPQSTTLRPEATGTNLTDIENLEGVWAFSYQANRHNNGSKSLFIGKTIPARFGPPYTTRLYGTHAIPGRYDLVIPGRSGSAGIEEGYEALAYLADLPFTQEFISVKLCRLFVHDNFEHGHYDYTDPQLSEEGRLVRACMEAWDGNTPRGQLRKVLEVIFNSELFRGHGGSMQKVKTPLEFTVTTLRTLRAQLSDGTQTAFVAPAGIVTALGRMGSMSLFNRSDPDGYPESAPGWISAGTLAERLRFVQALCIAPGQANRGDAGGCTVNPVALLKAKLPDTSWNDAGAVADYFLDLLFPGEGAANLDELRTAAIGYLDMSDNGLTSSPFSNLSNTTTAYDTRLRGMVAMLLSSPRFQEQ